mgnify:FL=1
MKEANLLKHFYDTVAMAAGVDDDGTIVLYS